MKLKLYFLQCVGTVLKVAAMNNNDWRLFLTSVLERKFAELHAEQFLRKLWPIIMENC
jgi:hypothetical protein